MSHEVTIYGAIFGSHGPTSSFYWLYVKNREVLGSLPARDSSPPLERTFCTIPMNAGKPGFHQTQMIHFGLSFRNFEDDWPIWLGKFESLISELYWTKVRLHLDSELFGEFDYCWDATPEALRGFAESRPQPVRDWVFAGGPRDFGE